MWKYRHVLVLLQQMVEPFASKLCLHGGSQSWSGLEHGWPLIERQEEGWRPPPLLTSGRSYVGMLGVVEAREDGHSAEIFEPVLGTILYCSAVRSVQVLSSAKVVRLWSYNVFPTRTAAAELSARFPSLSGVGELSSCCKVERDGLQKKVVGVQNAGREPAGDRR